MFVLFYCVSSRLSFVHASIRQQLNLFFKQNMRFMKAQLNTQELVMTRIKSMITEAIISFQCTFCYLHHYEL